MRVSVPACPKASPQSSWRRSIGPDSHDWSRWLVPTPVLKTGGSMSRKALRSVRFRRQSCTDAVMDNHGLLREVPVGFFSQCIRSLLFSWIARRFRSAITRPRGRRAERLQIAPGGANAHLRAYIKATPLMAARAKLGPNCIIEYMRFARTRPNQATLIARTSAARASTGITGSSPLVLTGRLRR